MSDYRCVSCGSSNVGINLARPSVDDRYVIGHCGSEKKARTLVRVDVYGRAVQTAAQREAIRDRADAARAVTDPTFKSRKKLTPERVALGKQALAEIER